MVSLIGQRLKVVEKIPETYLKKVRKDLILLSTMKAVRLVLKVTLLEKLLEENYNIEPIKMIKVSQKKST